MSETLKGETIILDTDDVIGWVAYYTSDSTTGSYAWSEVFPPIDYHKDGNPNVPRNMFRAREDALNEVRRLKNTTWRVKARLFRVVLKADEGELI